MRQNLSRFIDGISGCIREIYNDLKGDWCCALDVHVDGPVTELSLEQSILIALSKNSRVRPNTCLDEAKPGPALSPKDACHDENERLNSSKLISRVCEHEELETEPLSSSQISSTEIDINVEAADEGKDCITVIAEEFEAINLIDCTDDMQNELAQISHYEPKNKRTLRDAFKHKEGNNYCTEDDSRTQNQTLDTISAISSNPPKSPIRDSYDLDWELL